MTSLTSMVSHGDVYSICEAVKAALEDSNPFDVVERLIVGLREAGNRFQIGEIAVTGVISAANAFKEAMNVLEPILDKKSRQFRGKVVLGTVHGDIHDIGKNLIALMLEGAGFEVVDLGIDVAPETFVTAVKEFQPHLLGMSALLTTTMLEMETTINALKNAGLRESVGILVGGAPVSERYAKSIGADGYAKSATEAVDTAIALLEG